MESYIVLRNDRKTISAAEARRRFSTILGEVAFGHKEYIVTRKGRPMVRIVHIESADERHNLGDVEGWLEEEDPFFEVMKKVECARQDELPRGMEIE